MVQKGVGRTSGTFLERLIGTNWNADGTPEGVVPRRVKVFGERYLRQERTAGVRTKNGGTIWKIRKEVRKIRRKRERGHTTRVCAGTPARGWVPPLARRALVLYAGGPLVAVPWRCGPGGPVSWPSPPGGPVPVCPSPPYPRGSLSSSGPGGSAPMVARLTWLYVALSSPTPYPTPPYSTIPYVAHRSR